MRTRNFIKLNRFIDNLITQIIQNKKIALFVHADPDFDALGSAFGLRDVIKRNFKDKEVHVIDMQKAIDEDLTSDLYPATEELYFNPEEFCKDAVCISVDTPCLSRVLGKEYFKLGKVSFRIDHHEYLENFTDYEYVDKDASSACELVTFLIMKANLIMPSSSATYLYAGLLTDTNRFMFDCVNDNTYLAAIILYKAKADRQKVHKTLYTRTFNQIKYENYLFNLAKFKDHVASLFIPRDSNKQFDIINLKGFVYVIANIKDYPVWVCGRWNENKQTYSCSVRSLKMPIFDIAKKYQGGGHMLASGCIVKDENEFNELVQDLIEGYKEYSKKEENEN